MSSTIQAYTHSTLQRRQHYINHVTHMVHDVSTDAHGAYAVIYREMHEMLYSPVVVQHAPELAASRAKGSQGLGWKVGADGIHDVLR